MTRMGICWRRAGRWQEPTNTGFQVLSPRKALLSDEANLYEFVSNIPTDKIDPRGLWQWGWPPWGNAPKPKPPTPNPSQPSNNNNSCKSCDDSNPGSQLFKQAADNLASTLHDSDLTPQQVKAIS